MNYHRILSILAVCILFQPQASLAHISNTPHVHEVNPFFVLAIVMGCVSLLLAFLYVRSPKFKALSASVAAFVKKISMLMVSPKETSPKETSPKETS